MKHIKRTFTFLLALLTSLSVVVIAHLGITTCLRINAPTMPFIEPDPQLQLNYQPYATSLEKWQIRAKLDDIMDTGLYIETFTDFQGGTLGQCNSYFRVVWIDKDISTIDYVWTMCHELVHLKHHTICERYTNYMTFVYLYNSEFRPMAINLACSMRDGGFTEEYNAYMQIEQYLIDNLH